jgi:hypothetical protein
MHYNQKNEELIWFSKQITRLLCFFAIPNVFFQGGEGRKNMQSELNCQSFGGLLLTTVIGVERCTEHCFGKQCLKF